MSLPDSVFQERRQDPRVLAVMVTGEQMTLRLEHVSETWENVGGAWRLVRVVGAEGLII